MSERAAFDPIGNPADGPARGRAPALSGACARLERAVADLERALAADDPPADRRRHAELTERLDAAIGRLRSVLGE